MDNNPLKQYFRRPAVYLRLPSGGKDYPPGMIDIPETGELPVYPMTAIDEITTRTPDALFNGTALAELIRSCIPGIKDPWAVSSNDMDSILIAIKAASGGNTLDIDSECQKCNETNKYGINLVSLLTTLKPADYDTPMNHGDLKIKFKPLKYKEMNEASLGQFELQKVLVSLDKIESDDERNKVSKTALERITLLTMDILSKTIEYIETPAIRVEETAFIIDFLKNCDRALYVAIREYNTKLREAAEIKPLHIKCANCGNEYDQPFTLSPTDFFE